MPEIVVLYDLKKIYQSKSVAFKFMFSNLFDLFCKYFWSNQKLCIKNIPLLAGRSFTLKYIQARHCFLWHKKIIKIIIFRKDNKLYKMRSTTLGQLCQALPTRERRRAANIPAGEIKVSLWKCVSLFITPKTTWLLMPHRWCKTCHSRLISRYDLHYRIFFLIRCTASAW